MSIRICALRKLSFFFYDERTPGIFIVLNALKINYPVVILSTRCLILRKTPVEYRLRTFLRSVSLQTSAVNFSDA